MKIDIGKNEAYIKLSLRDGDIICAYGYDMDKPEGGFDIENPEHEAISSFICLLAGITTSMSMGVEDLIAIGVDALASGEFELDLRSGIALSDFLEGLSEEDEKLLNTHVVGGKQ